MGSQQLLLIILGMIVVGIMVIVGISLFNDHASATNRDAVANDLVHASSMAQMLGEKRLSVAGMPMPITSAVGVTVTWMIVPARQIVRSTA